MKSASETVPDQVGRTDAEPAAFIQASDAEFRARETLDLEKTLAEYSFLRDGPAEMIVSQVAQDLARNSANYGLRAVMQLADDAARQQVSLPEATFRDMTGNHTVETIRG